MRESGDPRLFRHAGRVDIGVTVVIGLLGATLAWLAWQAYGSWLAAVAGAVAAAVGWGALLFLPARSRTRGPPRGPGASDREVGEGTEARLRRLLNNVRDIVFRYRLYPDRGFDYLNEAVTEVLGYTPTEYYENPDLGLEEVHPEDRRGLEETLAGEIDFREPRIRRWIHRDGHIVWLEQRATPQYDESGRLVAIEGISREITEQVRDREALREARDALETLIRASPLAVMALDPEGRVQIWNPAAERMLGWTAEEVIGRPPPFVSEAGRDEFERLRNRVLRGEQLSGTRIRRQRRDGEMVELELWAAPLHDAEGVVTGVMALLDDVTDREALERRLFLSQRLESVGRLAGGVAHDFNNLLTAVLGNCELLLEELDPGDPARSEVEEIRQSAERAADLTRQLLAFSRKQVLQPRVLDLNSVLGGMERMLRRVIGEDIDLITVKDPSLGKVRADPAQLEHVLVTLAANARHSMPKGGVLTLETGNVELDEEYARAHIAVEPGPYVLLAVTDTGAGMDEEARARIFEPFFTTRERGHGKGLGLATVYGIVKQSGGNIWVYSEPGAGTTFKIYLPRVDAEASVGAESRTEGLVTGGSETVLVVEDEPALRTLARAVLERAGYTVLMAADGGEALELARDHRGDIDLLLTDVVLPGMSGVVVARELQSRRPDMRVLYMSGYTEERMVQQGALTPGTSFIAKPFGSGELMGKVREVLDRPTGSAATD